jgi:hypothetical protein
MRIKTKFLISVLENAMPAAGQKYTFSGGFEFVYPTAPNRVKLPDVKDEMNIVTEGDMYTNTEIYPKTESDMWAWGFGDYATEEIKLCDKSIRCLLRLMKTEGPFAGVIGFSTGATTGSILLSLAERGAADEITQQWGLDSSVSKPIYRHQLAGKLTYIEASAITAFQIRYLFQRVHTIAPSIQNSLLSHAKDTGTTLYR